MPSRKFRSEGPILYNRYRFGYCEWQETGVGEDPGEAYGEGYLPYSAEPGSRQNLFYMARSLRIKLGQLEIDKKRRYNYRQWEDFGLQRQLMKKDRFMDLYGDQATSLAEEWMVARFGKPYLGPERLAYILEKPFLNNVLTWSKKGELTAFALLVCGEWGAHYWFAFYKNGNQLQAPPGHGYLVDFLQWARSEQLPYAYLGTSYGNGSRYKSRGLAGIEFWDGNGWNGDRDELARLRDLDEAAVLSTVPEHSDASETADDKLV